MSHQTTLQTVDVGAAKCQNGGIEFVLMDDAFIETQTDTVQIGLADE